MQKPKRLPLGRPERRPMRAGRLQEPEGPDHVGRDKILGAVDRAIHVALGGEVDERPRAVLGQEPRHEFPVGDVTPHEPVPRVAREAREVGQVAGVGELVEVHDRLVGAGEPVEHEVAADEAGAAGDEDHGCMDG
jgi:hypothetical protein